MPRCQRTFHRLTVSHVEAGTGILRWTCARCPDAETYAAVRDPDLLHYRDFSQAFCVAGFGAPHDPQRPAFLLLGLRPECVYEQGDQRYDIYLQEGSDPCQMRYQIGHEMFHRVCSRGRIFHWSHEMLACMVSARLLRRHGMQGYAEAMERDWRADAGDLPLQEMLRIDLRTLSPYPLGFYGRAFVTGAALARAVGWDRLRLLARCFSARGAPDVEGWLAHLPPNAGARARAVLAGTDGGGVE